MKEAWESYKDMVVPKEASREQLIGTELAFYAGASMMLSVVCHISNNFPEGEAEARMESIETELKAHPREVIKRAFK
jgi:hypothetical protein